jgi:hypothetical protein
MRIIHYAISPMIYTTYILVFLARGKQQTRALLNSYTYYKWLKVYLYEVCVPFYSARSGVTVLVDQNLLTDTVFTDASFLGATTFENVYITLNVV